MAEGLNICQSTEKFLSVFLESSKIVGKDNIFVVGSFDNKKTIATQQLRAAVIALGLNERADNQKLNVAVVGAGFAGLTATSTLLKLGHSVTLLERSSHLLPIQRDCTERFIHPNLYDWPMVNPIDRLKIGGLGWVAGSAASVVDSVESDFRRISNKFRKKFRVVFDANVTEDIVQMESGGKFPNLELRASGKKAFTASGFDAVLLLSLIHI